MLKARRNRAGYDQETADRDGNEGHDEDAQRGRIAEKKRKWVKRTKPTYL